MAKIVIIAPAGTDVDDAVKLLKNNGNEVEVEEPTPKSLLHIVLGLLGPSAYGFGPGYAFSPGEQADDSVEDLPAEDELPVDDAPADDLDGAEDVDIPGGDDDFKFEGVEALVDGEKVLIERVESDVSTLIVENLQPGPHAVYSINESQFSFWPADVEAPATRVQVAYGKHSTVLEMQIQKGERTVLQVGNDLADLFQQPKPAEAPAE